MVLILKLPQQGPYNKLHLGSFDWGCYGIVQDWTFVTHRLDSE